MSKVSKIIKVETRVSKEGKQYTVCFTELAPDTAIFCPSSAKVGYYAVVDYRYSISSVFDKADIK